MQTPKKVILFPNGTVSCFDENGQQTDEQSKGWLELWLEWMEGQGVDPTEIGAIESYVNGRWVLLQPFRTEYGWNYHIIPIHQIPA